MPEHNNKKNKAPLKRAVGESNIYKNHHFQVNDYYVKMHVNGQYVKVKAM